MIKPVRSSVKNLNWSDLSASRLSVSGLKGIDGGRLPVRFRRLNRVEPFIAR